MANLGDLCESYRTVGYTFFRGIIEDIPGKWKHEEYVEYLTGAIEKILEGIEYETKSTVDSFRIGKSSTREKKTRRFDSNDPMSWCLKNISGRWSYYKKEQYSGLVVLACTTKENIPADVRRYQQKVDVEKYAQLLVSLIVENFELQGDARCGNHKYAPGPPTRTPVCGGLVFLVYKVKVCIVIKMNLGYLLGIPNGMGHQT